MSTPAARCLVLRLAAPLQSWGGRSQFNRRETLGEPTKSGVVGLLAAAQGRARHKAIDDLLALPLGVRTDQPGTLLRDFHTVADFRGLGLPTATVDAKGRQKRRPTGASQLTERYYLQDAVFVAAIQGPEHVVDGLADAVRRPAFPLALGRRACPPTQPLLLPPPGEERLTWAGSTLEVLERVPWQGGPAQRKTLTERQPRPRRLDLAVTVDIDPDRRHDHGASDRYRNDVRMDLPRSFDPRERSFTVRRVRETWVHVPPPYEVTADDYDEAPPHDPFALLGW